MEISPVEILKKFWGFDAFRSPQEEIVRNVLEGKDTLALLPTGAGKSVCYQVPGLILPGLTIVISPLIALMRDQVEGLNKKEIAATVINSTLSIGEIDQKLNNAMKGKYRFLYLAPERLKTEMFLKRLPSMNISLLAIDEAHCISQWGYDFRPSYLEIAKLRALLPDVPVIALTASATLRVKEDIKQKLNLKNEKEFVKSFRRNNISYRCEETDNVVGRIIGQIKRSTGSAIVYARTRKRVEKLAELLQKNGVNAIAYHGGMDNTKREEVQNEWIENKSRVICATNAFGMGIDKPDVRLVLHLNLPSDIESYYQEAGRAGRDGNPSIALSFFNQRDINELTKWVEEKYPPWDFVLKSYDALNQHFRIAEGTLPDSIFNVDLAFIAKTYSIPSVSFFNAVKILHNEGILSLEEMPDRFGYLRITATPGTVIAFKEANPSWEEPMDFILRTLGGEAWYDEVKFNPVRWAREMRKTYDELNRLLHTFAQREMITYRQPTELPTLRFLVPRRKLRKEELNWEKYTMLAQLGKERLEALLKFAEGKQLSCRSLEIENYFGEKGGQPCGICDLCITRNSNATGKELIKLVYDECQTLLNENSIPVTSLLSQMQSGERKNRENAVRYLMDEGYLILKPGGLVEFNKKKKGF